jgi:hypothetical protein
MKVNRINPSFQNAYHKQNLRAFSSHEDANESDAKEMAALSTAEHFQYVNRLIRELFADELKKPMNKKLRFRKGIDC